MTARTTTLRTVTVLAAAAIAALPLAGVASAAPAADKDCTDYSSPAAAQAALQADPSDPNGLDRDHDGRACENAVYGSGRPATSARDSSGSASGSASSGGSSSGTAAQPAQVVAVPSGSVDAGDGSAAGEPGRDAVEAFVLAGFGAVAASGAAVTVWRTRRPARRRG